jgi:hypothetical protein
VVAEVRGKKGGGAMVLRHIVHNNETEVNELSDSADQVMLAEKSKRNSF